MYGRCFGVAFTIIIGLCLTDAVEFSSLVNKTTAVGASAVFRADITNHENVTFTWSVDNIDAAIISFANLSWTAEVVGGSDYAASIKLQNDGSLITGIAKSSISRADDGLEFVIKDDSGNNEVAHLSVTYCSREVAMADAYLEFTPVCLQYMCKATHQCSNGLLVEGLQSRQCLTNGQWSGTTPTCVNPPTGGMTFIAYILFGAVMLLLVSSMIIFVVLKNQKSVI